MQSILSIKESSNNDGRPPPSDPRLNTRHASARASDSQSDFRRRDCVVDQVETLCSEDRIADKFTSVPAVDLNVRKEM